jgi:hypothetical protein
MNTRLLLSIALVAGFATAAHAQLFRMGATRNLSSVSNIVANGYLSISGETNRLTVAGDALLLDGSAIGGDTIWDNTGGVIAPASGQTTNTLRFTSGAADNATNVAVVVNAVNAWTNTASILSVQMEGAERFEVHPFTLTLGKNTKTALPNWHQDAGLTGFFDQSEGDLANWSFLLGSTDGTGNSQGSIQLNGDTSASRLTILSRDDSGNESAFYFDTKQTGGQNESSLYVYSNNNETFVLSPDGNVTITGKVITQGGAASTPASAGATGTAGEIRWDSGFIYICVAANTWKRVAIATW